MTRWSPLMPGAKKQKSFLEQGPESRTIWHRNSKPRYAHTPEPGHTQSTMASAPIAASSLSRSKLEVFRCKKKLQKASFSQNDAVKERVATGKENTMPVGNRKTTGDQCATNQLKVLSQGLGKRERKDCPQTPNGRLPLVELIANGEDAAKLPILTPVERVVWDYDPRDAEIMSSSATAPSQNGKRRRSGSSPDSSSQNEASTHVIVAKVTIDPQYPQQSQTTPQADPAYDLWHRYLLNPKDKSTEVESTFQQLIHSSSPDIRSKEMGSNDTSGLRRSMSCGIEWPTSAAKRRKIQRSKTTSRGDECVAAIEVAVEYPHRSTSRVKFLVERIQDVLARPTKEETKQSPSSSLPPPDDTGRESEASPLNRFEGKSRLDVAPVSQDKPVHVDEAVIEDYMELTSNTDISQQGFNDTSISSDFGEDDIDLEALEAIGGADEDVWQNPAVSRLRQDTPLHNENVMHTKLDRTEGNPTINEFIESISPKRLSIGERRLSVEVYRAEKARDTRKPDADKLMGSDEFDEDDSEVLAADLEDVAALYDRREMLGPQAAGEESPKNVEFRRQQLTPLLMGYPLNDDEAGHIRTMKSIVEVSSDEEFGNDDDLEQLVDECARASQAHAGSIPVHSSNLSKPSTIQRYMIMKVVESQYDDEKGRQKFEKVLLVQDEQTKLNKAIMLRQSWFDSPCSTGSYVHLIGEFDTSGQCIVDDFHNMLIVHPDHLISATVVADSFSCTRRAVLQDRVKATSEATKPLVYGQILHEIFQEAMRENRWDDQWMTMTIDKIATSHLESLFEINVELVQAVEYLKSKVTELQGWAEVFVSAKPKIDAIVKDRNGAQALMCVNKLLDVEEHVWSPMYGLKGNVDATVQVVMQDGDDKRVLTVPFEVKTGKNVRAEHKAQTSLYTLLLSDRYDVQIAYGILYYMETSEISRIPGIRHELIHMVMQRNELASYVRHRLELPPMLKRPHLCGRCYAKTPCFIYHKLMDDGNGETSGMKERFDELVQHLSPTHRDFFRRWDDLLTKEEKELLKFRRELWTMKSSEREKVGRCFGSLVIEPGSSHELGTSQKINRFEYTLVRQKFSTEATFIGAQIGVGEPIVISDEKGHFALANGFVTKVRKQKITVAVDRRLHNARARGRGFDAQRNQVFAGIMEVVSQGGTQNTSTTVQSDVSVVYRLDKDEFSNGMATVRNNLISVMEKDEFGARSLRRLIVEGASPSFGQPNTPYALSNSITQENLNVDQRMAIEKVMTAKDYALVLGMPGTGKTTTIAHLIRALVAQGKSVLLTSYTHTAVDNILLKIRHDNIGIFRLGAVAKVHPEVQEFANLAGIPMKSVTEIQKAYNQQVVATTCLGVTHAVFNQRIFDYCIVDEASQITLPVCLGPIRMAKTFILVGDHYQLPPLVQNKEALEGGLANSLFQLLSDSQPSSVVNLEHQYRMCEEIMTLSNVLIYDGRLKCGTEAVARRSLNVPNMSALRFHHHQSLGTLSHIQTRVCMNPTKGSCWLRDLLDPSVKACFVNTDLLGPRARESESGSRFINNCEATLCMQLVEALVCTGVVETDVGVITLYRSQLALIKQNLRHRTGVEMHTADKFQGRDKEVVVLSLVRSNDGGNVGDLLKDWRRVNVALTRARTKLLVLGSRSTLKNNELLQKFLALMDQKGWRYDLPVGALDSHLFDDGATQFTGKASVSANAAILEAKILKSAPANRPQEEKKDKGRMARKQFKVPHKVARIDPRALLERRGVLRDISNDAF